MTVPKGQTSSLPTQFTLRYDSSELQAWKCTQEARPALSKTPFISPCRLSPRAPDSSLAKAYLRLAQLMVVQRCDSQCGDLACFWPWIMYHWRVLPKTATQNYRIIWAGKDPQGFKWMAHPEIEPTTSALLLPSSLQSHCAVFLTRLCWVQLGTQSTLHAVCYFAFLSDYSREKQKLRGVIYSIWKPPAITVLHF